jgi:hypothetical protein
MRLGEAYRLAALVEGRLARGLEIPNGVTSKRPKFPSNIAIGELIAGLLRV